MPAQRKRPLNPNTAYGRRRIQEEAFQKDQQWRIEHPKEASQQDITYTILGVLVVVVILILWFIIHTNNNDYYGPRGGHYKINSKGNKEYYKDKK